MKLFIKKRLVCTVTCKRSQNVQVLQSLNKHARSLTLFLKATSFLLSVRHHLVAARHICLSQFVIKRHIHQALRSLAVMTLMHNLLATPMAGRVPRAWAPAGQEEFSFMGPDSCYLPATAPPGNRRVCTGR